MRLGAGCIARKNVASVDGRISRTSDRHLKRERARARACVGGGARTVDVVYSNEAGEAIEISRVEWL